MTFQSALGLLMSFLRVLRGVLADRKVITLPRRHSLITPTHRARQDRAGMSQPGCPSATKHARPVLDSPAAGRSATDDTGSGEQYSANTQPSKDDKHLVGEKRKQRGPAEDPLVRIPDAGFNPEQMSVLMKVIQDQVKTALEAQRAVNHPLLGIMPQLPTSSPYQPSPMHLGTLLQAALPVGGHAWNLQPNYMQGHILPHQQAVIADPGEVKKRQMKEISDLKVLCSAAAATISCSRGKIIS